MQHRPCTFNVTALQDPVEGNFASLSGALRRAAETARPLVASPVPDWMSEHTDALDAAAFAHQLALDGSRAAPDDAAALKNALNEA